MDEDPDHGVDVQFRPSILRNGALHHARTSRTISAEQPDRMITHFRIENFKGHRDTDLALERFTVLVGDNGSGKTSVLEALQLPGRLGKNIDDLALEELLRRGANHIRLSSEGATHHHRWKSSLEITAPGHSPWGDAWVLKAGGRDPSGQFGGESRLDAVDGYNEALRKITSLMGPVGLYRFRSDQVATSAYSDQAGASVAEDGALTAVVLAALKLADDAAFNNIESAMRRIAPSLQRVFIKPATLKHPSNPNPVTGSKLYFDFRARRASPPTTRAREPSSRSRCSRSSTGLTGRASSCSTISITRCIRAPRWRSSG
jgi:hypothetical protein